MDRLSLDRVVARIRRSLRTRIDGHSRKIDDAPARVIIRKRARRDASGKYTEEPAAWITLHSNHQHVPLNSQGIAIGGAGGWATGKDFSKAKNSMGKKKGSGEKTGGQGAKTSAAGKAGLRKAAADASKKCRDALRDVLMARKIADIQLKEGDAGVENAKANARTEAESLEKKLKSAQKKLDKMKAEQGGSGKTREELSSSIREKKKESAKLFNKLYDLNLSKEERQETSAKFKAIREELQKETKEMESIDAAISQQGRVNKLTRDLEEQKDLADAIDRYQKGKLKNPQELEKEHKAMADARDKAVLDAFSSVSECEDARQVTNYLRAKGYYRKTGQAIYDDSTVDISKMTTENAVAYGRRIEKLMDDYPWLKGKLDGIDCHDFSNEKGTKRVYGYANDTHLSFAEGFFGDPSNAKKTHRGDAKSFYEGDVESGYHPPGTDYTAVVDHEHTHAMAKLVKQAAKEKGISLYQGSVENEVMKRVQEKLYGSYSKYNEQDVREKVSRYAGRNEGVARTTYGVTETSYGRNTEFLAEAMAEARCSAKPREIAVAAREAFEELIKEVGLS